MNILQLSCNQLGLKTVSLKLRLYFVGLAGRLNSLTSSTGLVYPFSGAAFQAGGKHASVHGPLFLQLLIQLLLSLLQVLPYIGICGRKMKFCFGKAQSPLSQVLK